MVHCRVIWGTDRIEMQLRTNIRYFAQFFWRAKKFCPIILSELDLDKKLSWFESFIFYKKDQNLQP